MNELKIGWGKRELSLDEPMPLAGQMYMRVSTGIHDPLYATVMCLEAEQTVIFCTLDVVVLRNNVIPGIREAVRAICPEIPVENIVMGATHTHSSGILTETPERSPDGQKLFTGDQFRDHVIKQTAEAVVEAWNNRSPGGMAYGYGYAVVGHSRRVCYLKDMSAVIANKAAPNGHAIMYGKTDREEFSHYEAGADHFLNLMFTFDRQDQLTGIVVNVPCPSQLSEHFTRISADFWNEVRQMVAKEYGDHVFVLPQCAAAGDLSPRTLHYRQAQARRMALKYDLPYEVDKIKPDNEHEYNKVMGERYDIAERILEGIRDVYSWAKKDIRREVKIVHQKLNLKLQRRMLSEEEKNWCEENIEQMRQEVPSPEGCTPEEYRKKASHFASIRGRNERAIQRYYTQQENPTLDSSVHVIRVGDIAFATTRFELYMDFMHRVQARSPFIQTFVIQLAGDEGGSYLPTQRGKEGKGYSASIFCNMVGPEGGQQWVEAVVENLKNMY